MGKKVYNDIYKVFFDNEIFGIRNDCNGFDIFFVFFFYRLYLLDNLGLILFGIRYVY